MVVSAHTSSYGLGRVLLQKHGGHLHPVAFASHTSFIHSFHLFAFINYRTKLHVIIIHLAGSPGSYVAYLKDCLKKRSKKLECKLSMAEQKY